MVLDSTLFGWHVCSTESFHEQSNEHRNARNLHKMGYDKRGENEFLSALGNSEMYMQNIGQCINEFFTSFTSWIKELCIESLIDCYESNHHDYIVMMAETIVKDPKKIIKVVVSEDEYIEANQEYLGHDTSLFFEQFRESGKCGNEMWLFKRVNAVAAHIRKEIDLFAMSEKIRRSIIFCSKSSNSQFIISLNNKLSR